MCEHNGAKTANILAPAIYLEKVKFGRLRGLFFDSFSAAVPVDGGCFGSFLLRHILTNQILENIKQRNDLYTLSNIQRHLLFLKYLKPFIKH